MNLPASLSVPVTRLFRGQPDEPVQDEVAAEEPLELRVEGKSIAVVMRTPGHDEELAAGFLLTEGVITGPQDVFEISICPSRSEGYGGVVDVLLAKGEVDWSKLTRHVFASSSCGVCGKATIESVFQSFAPRAWDWTVPRELVWSLPDKLRAAQLTFEKTGGLHASAIFDLDGQLVVAREDVAAIPPWTRLSGSPSGRAGCLWTATCFWLVVGCPLNSCRRHWLAASASWPPSPRPAAWRWTSPGSPARRWSAFCGAGA